MIDMDGNIVAQFEVVLGPPLNINTVPPKNRLILADHEKSYLDRCVKLVHRNWTLKMIHDYTS